jgi:MOSC domain-containing protein
MFHYLSQELYRLDAGLFHSCHRAMGALEGTVLKVASDPQHGFSKHAKESINLVEGHGVEGDAHAGQHVRHRFLARRWSRLPNLRQLHLIPSELFEVLRTLGYTIGPGDLGENVTTVGLELEHLPLGTKLRLGQDAVVELTGLRTPCRLIDRFQKDLRSKMVRTDSSGPKFRCGVFAIIAIGGRVSPGDVAKVEMPRQPWSPLPTM